MGLQYGFVFWQITQLAVLLNFLRWLLFGNRKMVTLFYLCMAWNAERGRLFFKSLLYSNLTVQVILLIDHIFLLIFPAQ